MIAFIFIREAFAKLYEINKQYRFTNHYQLYYHIVHEDPCYVCIEKVVYNLDSTELPYTEEYALYENTTKTPIFGNSSADMLNSGGKPYYANYTREAVCVFCCCCCLFVPKTNSNYFNSV